MSIFILKYTVVTALTAFHCKVYIIPVIEIVNTFEKGIRIPILFVSIQ